MESLVQQVLARAKMDGGAEWLRRCLQREEDRSDAASPYLTPERRPREDREACGSCPSPAVDRDLLRSRAASAGTSASAGASAPSMSSAPVAGSDVDRLPEEDGGAHGPRKRPCRRSRYSPSPIRRASGKCGSRPPRPQRAVGSAKRGMEAPKTSGRRPGPEGSRADRVGPRGAGPGVARTEVTTRSRGRSGPATTGAAAGRRPDDRGRQAQDRGLSSEDEDSAGDMAESPHIPEEDRTEDRAQAAAAASAGGMNYHSCPAWNECINNPLYSFWKMASAAFAQASCGIVNVMLNGSADGAIARKESILRTVEIPSMDPDKVTEVKLWVIDDIQGQDKNSCNSESLLELQHYIEGYNLTYSCVDNYKPVQALQCMDDPDHHACNKCNMQ